jgi:hypothetical protein
VDAEKPRVRCSTRHLNSAALACVALLISAHIAFSVRTLGDYPGDAGPAISALLHGSLRAFDRARPAMGALSLLLRAPFTGLAYIGRPTQLSIYRWGSLPCVLSLALLALWLGRIARVRGAGVLGQWLILLVSLLNPVVSSSIATGHPEELLTSVLCIAALVAALETRALLCTILLGLALACKQWSVLAVLPVLFALDRSRVRALVGALVLAALVTAPEVLGAPVSFLHNQLHLADHRRGRTTSILSWFWLPAPNRTIHVVVEGVHISLRKHLLPRALVDSAHTLLISVDVLVAAAVARMRGLPLRREDAFALMALVLLLRCTLCLETMPYYHAPLFADLLAWDALRGERIPIRALAAAGASYVLFERIEPVAGASTTSLCYCAVTVIAAILFLRTLSARRSSLPRRAEALVALEA